MFLKRLFVGALSFLGMAVWAQDTRAVVEPVVPPVCVRLVAALTADANGLAAGDEGKLDTARVQKALNECGQEGGGAFGWRRTQCVSFRAVVTGRGVTLLVDKGVTLYGSRDRRCTRWLRVAVGW